MQINFKPFIHILSTLIIFTFSWGVDYPASLEIRNVDTDAGTLDIYMKSQVGCKLLSTGGDFDASYTDETACVDAGTGGNTWYDGQVGGVQIELTGGITIDAPTGASGGTAEANGWMANTSNDPLNLILLFTISGDYLPAGEGILTQVTFSNYTAGTGICFGEDTGSSGNTAVSAASSAYVAANWGACYCDGQLDDCGVCNGENANKDCAGVCGGDAETTDCGCDESASDITTGCCTDGLGPNEGAPDCAGVCGGTAVVDCADVCNGDAEDYNGDGVAGCGEMSISQIGSNLPTEFSISQNFPNPFNPITSITFDVAKMDEVSLVVYDLTGKEVATLVSGTYTPGTYNVEWNAVNNAGDGFVSGMYIYRYISSEKAITRKMLYLK